MDYPNNTISRRKQKHLNFEERMTIQLRLKDGYAPYRIAHELGRPLTPLEMKSKEVQFHKLYKARLL